jgi:hypothetical protein
MPTDAPTERSRPRRVKLPTRTPAAPQLAILRRAALVGVTLPFYLASPSRFALFALTYPTIGAVVYQPLQYFAAGLTSAGLYVIALGSYLATPQSSYAPLGRKASCGGSAITPAIDHRYSHNPRMNTERR